MPWQQLIRCATRLWQFQVQNMTILHCLGQEEIHVQVQGTVKYSIKILYLETWWGIQCTLSPLIMDSHQVLYTTRILVGIMGYRLIWLNWLQSNGLYTYVIITFHILLCWYFIGLLASSHRNLQYTPMSAVCNYLVPSPWPCHLSATWGDMTWSQTTHLTWVLVNIAVHLHIT